MIDEGASTHPQRSRDQSFFHRRYPNPLIRGEVTLLRALAAKELPGPQSPGALGAVDDIRRNLQIDQSAALAGGANAQFAAHFVCALTHAWKTPVATAIACFQYFLIDAAAVIAHAHVQSAGLVCDSHHNILGAGVAEGVGQRL